MGLVEYKMDVIIQVIALVINSYIIYKMIQSHMAVKRLTGSLESCKHYEWLCSLGMYEMAIKFNKWGQITEIQPVQFGHDFGLPNIKW